MTTNVFIREYSCNLPAGRQVRGLTSASLRLCGKLYFTIVTYPVSGSRPSPASMI